MYAKWLADAKPLMLEDLAASRETLGDRHPNTFASINNLANLLQAQGHLADAEPVSNAHLTLPPKA